MKLAFKQLQLQGLKKQQQLLLATCGVLVVSNLVLVLSYINNDQQWILIPQLNPEHRVQLNQASYSDEYLQEWAGDILQDVFTANPASIKGKVKRTLEISRSSYTDLREKLQNQVKLVKDNSISTVFYPKRYRHKVAKRQVLVTGDFLTFFGGDQKPVITTKTFSLSYERGPHGVILLAGLEEVGDA